MKGFTICLEERDLETLRNEARRISIPPATLARSLLVRALTAWSIEETGAGKLEGGE